MLRSKQNGKNILWALMVSFTLNGCFSSHYYVLSSPSEPSVVSTSKHMHIGVEKVVVPQYLFKREIAIAKSNSEVEFLTDGTWAEDLDAGLTARFISFLQKKFQQPTIHAYPWGSDTQPDKKLKVTISRFIAQNDTVYLDANYEIENMKTGFKKAKLFSTTTPLDAHDTSSIVSSMDKALIKLEESISLNFN